MTLELKVTPEVQAEIEAQARVKGMTVDEYVLSVVELLVPTHEFDLDGLLELPREQQKRILETASERAAPEYREDLSLPPFERELTAFTALDGEDLADES